MHHIGHTVTLFKMKMFFPLTTIEFIFKYCGEQHSGREGGKNVEFPFSKSKWCFIRKYGAWLSIDHMLSTYIVQYIVFMYSLKKSEYKLQIYSWNMVIKFYTFFHNVSVFTETMRKWRLTGWFPVCRTTQWWWQTSDWPGSWSMTSTRSCHRANWPGWRDRIAGRGTRWWETLTGWLRRWSTVRAADVQRYQQTSLLPYVCYWLCCLMF